MTYDNGWIRVMSGTGLGGVYEISNRLSETAMTTRNCLALSSGEPESDPRICKSVLKLPVLFWILNM